MNTYWSSIETQYYPDCDPPDLMSVWWSGEGVYNPSHIEFDVFTVLVSAITRPAAEGMMRAYFGESIVFRFIDQKEDGWHPSNKEEQKREG